jgi:hypothetical protein
MRRIVLSLSSIVAVAVTFLTAAPSAFAMRITPTSGYGPSVTASSVAHHAGLASWEISLMVVAGVLLAVTLLTVAILRSRRSVPTPGVA